MKISYASLTLSISLILITTVSSSSGSNKGTNKRTHTEDLSTVNCVDAFDKCRTNQNCRAALHGLNKRCKVVDGRCSAEMVDLPRCGQIMDHLFMYGFPEKKCKSDRKRSDRFLATIEKIYDNPCFVSIRHLRKINLFPNTVDAYDIASTTATMTKSNMNKNQNEDIDVIDATTIKPKINYDVTDHDAKNLRKMHLRKIGRTETKTSTIGPKGTIKTTQSGDINIKKKIFKNTHEDMKDSSISEDTQTTNQRHEKHDQTDYKLLTIILGTLLGICIFITVIYFAWARITGAIFYTKCKTVDTERRQDEPNLLSPAPKQTCLVKKEDSKSEQYSRA